MCFPGGFRTLFFFFPEQTMESLRDNEALPQASKLNLREDFLRILIDAGTTREDLRLL